MNLLPSLFPNFFPHLIPLSFLLCLRFWASIMKRNIVRFQYSLNQMFNYAFFEKIFNKHVMSNEITKAIKIKNANFKNLYQYPQSFKLTCPLISLFLLYITINCKINYNYILVHGSSVQTLDSSECPLHCLPP